MAEIPECYCSVQWDETIDYCPMHKAAPEMLAALDEIAEVGPTAHPITIQNIAIRVIAQAR